VVSVALLARHRTRMSALIDPLVDLPIVLPPAVAGLARLWTSGRRGLFGPSLPIFGGAVLAWAHALATRTRGQRVVS
jgi:ABC-type molybdate transport system permease subunit